MMSKTMLPSLLLLVLGLSNMLVPTEAILMGAIKLFESNNCDAVNMQGVTPIAPDGACVRQGPGSIKFNCQAKTLSLYSAPDCLGTPTSTGDFSGCSIQNSKSSSALTCQDYPANKLVLATIGTQCSGKGVSSDTARETFSLITDGGCYPYPTFSGVSSLYYQARFPFRTNYMTTALSNNKNCDVLSNNDVGTIVGTVGTCTMSDSGNWAMGLYTLSNAGMIRMSWMLFALVLASWFISIV